MFEKVNPSHPDKVADRIAGAVIDMGYALEKRPKMAVEVLYGHGLCTVIAESSVAIPREQVKEAALRISGVPEDKIKFHYIVVPQDEHLADNQKSEVRCGDNGIFKGVPLSSEQFTLSYLASEIYRKFPTDGKYIINDKTDSLIICQSNAKTEDIEELIREKNPNRKFNMNINPLGYWTGGTDVDTGATNRKLGSDMGDSVTGGGLHGKDATKADVSVNIYAWLKAQLTNAPVELFCAIGDTMIDNRPYGEIVEIAEEYIKACGGFEKFAEWGYNVLMPIPDSIQSKILVDK